jgi:hypothetical protein
MTAIARLSENGGIVTPRLIRRVDPTLVPQTVRELHAGVDPAARGLPMWLRRFRALNYENVLRGLRHMIAAEQLGIPSHFGLLRARLLRRDGDILDFGLVSTRVVTTAGAAYLIDALQGIVEPENLKYHGIGTDNTAESAGQTGLIAECTTALNPDSTRATGSLTEGASSNIFRSVGTNTVDAAVTIVEHGLFSQAATGGGTMFDRSIFAGIGMSIGDSLETTYDWTLNTGG